MFRTRIAICLGLATIFVATSPLTEAGRFSRKTRGFTRQFPRPATRPVSDSTRYTMAKQNGTGTDHRGLQARTSARQLEKAQRISDRTGRSVDEIQARRIRRLEILGAALGGFADGLAGASGAIGYSSPSLTSPGTSAGPPSNFSGRMQMNAINRSYSTNPDHAPVTFGRP